MTEAEIRAQELTEDGWYLMKSRFPLYNGHDKKDGVYERCDRCKKERMMGGIIFNEDNTTRCIWCK